MSLQTGARLGPYEITGTIGAGGMGEVLRARDTRLNRDVAVKVLPAAFAQDRERVARFRREAQVVAALNHPNIASIYGLEEANGVTRKWQISVDGGTFPVWSPAGDEIFFLRGPQVVAATVGEKNGELAVGQPKTLFANHRVIAFDVARDGKRLLVAEDPNPGSQPRLDVVVNWGAEVRRKLNDASGP